MTFNIAFFADAHLGYAYANRTDPKGVNLRVRDGYEALHAIVEDMVRHKDDIDAVAMGGDMFHVSHPSILDIMTAQHYMRELRRAGLSVDILAGNHDATDNRSAPAAVAVLDDPDNGIFAHYAPYVKREIGGGVMLHALSHHGLHPDDSPVMEPEEGKINIFMTHGAAFDPDNQGLMRCMDSPREQIIGPEIILSEAFDLRVLGHFHQRTFVGHEALNTWYAGSTLRRGFSDAPGARGWTLFKIADNGQVEVEHHDIFQRPQHDLELIDASGMSSASVQELIIAHIDATREDEGVGGFNLTRAPILRQRVINVAPSLREALDRKLLADRASHALKWQLEMVKPAEALALGVEGVEEFNPDVDPHEHDAPSILQNAGRINMLSAYKTWVEGSSALRHLNADQRQPVIDAASDHLRKAEEAAS